MNFPHSKNHFLHSFAPLSNFIKTHHQSSMKTSILLLATLGLTFSSLSAQTVPEFLNYQGTVTDSAGLGLGDTAPVNRKVLFRIYNAATAGALVWTEEQTVTISKGEFSVLLGQGIQFASEPHDSLLDIFGEGATDRYVAITVDNGDGTLNGSDLAIAPRQRITSTAYSFRAGTADSIASGSSLKLNSADSGLGYYDSSRQFGGISVDGPVLYGAGGGALGVDNGAGTQTAALRWDSGGDVGIGVTAPLAGQKLHVAGSSYFDGSVKIVSPTATALTIQSPTAGGYGLKHTNGASALETWVSTGQANLESNGTLNILAASTLSLFTNNTQRLVVNSTGNVGIGTTTPSYKLDVLGAGNFSSYVQAFGGGFFEGSGYFTQSLAIGTYSQSGKLNVVGGYAYLDGLRISGVDTANSIWHPTGNISINTQSSSQSVTLGSNVNGTVLTVKGGNVGIGTSSPTVKLDVAGSVRSNNGSFFQDAVSGWEDSYIIKRAGGQVAAISMDPSGSKLHLSAGTGLAKQFTLTNSGNVGIGDPTAVRAKLNVIGVAGNASYGRMDYFTLFNGVQALAAGISSHSIYASSSVAALGFYAFSDERIKTSLELSDGDRDLKTLMRLEITDYHYKDVIAQGNRPHKKVIAQQVEAVYPQAVNESTDVVPDIYQQALIQDGWVNLATNLKAGERVRLIGEQEEGIHEVLEVDADGFRTTFKPASDQVFVYGREVDDFRSVDYEAIAMLNVSATQELARQLAAKNDVIESLLSENTSLAERLTELESKDAARDARLAAIEQLLSTK
jgi:hypothetical protein